MHLLEVLLICQLPGYTRPLITNRYQVYHTHHGAKTNISYELAEYSGLGYSGTVVHVYTRFERTPGHPGTRFEQVTRYPGTQFERVPG